MCYAESGKRKNDSGAAGFALVRLRFQNGEKPDGPAGVGKGVEKGGDGVLCLSHARLLQGRLHPEDFRFQVRRGTKGFPPGRKQSQTGQQQGGGKEEKSWEHWNGTAWTPMADSDTFVAGEYYRAVMKVVLKDDQKNLYKFTNKTRGEVNEETAKKRFEKLTRLEKMFGEE